MNQLLNQTDLYNCNHNAITPIELNEHQIALCKNNIISALLMTPNHIKKVRDKDALLHIVGSQENFDLVMGNNSFPVNHDA